MSMVTEDPAQIDSYIQSQRDNRGRVQSDRGRKIITTKKAVQQAIKKRLANAGMAKGAWLGAGKQIAAKQTGTQRINIGKNFMSYAQKHSNLGRATASTNPFAPEAKLINQVRYTASRNSLNSAHAKQAIDDALKKTVRWYQKAAKEALDK